MGDIHGFLHGFLAAPDSVPEPGTSWLGLLGLLGVTLRRARPSPA